MQAGSYRTFLERGHGNDAEQGRSSSYDLDGHFQHRRLRTVLLQPKKSCYREGDQGYDSQNCQEDRIVGFVASAFLILLRGWELNCV